MNNERITPNSTGGVDEVVRYKTTVHVEQMSHEAYWMSVGEDHFWFTLEGTPGEQRIELRHVHDDGTAEQAVKCCCVDGPALAGRKPPLKEDQCGHCHCCSAEQGSKYCCWCRNVAPIGRVSA